jgi:hypothetical protein
MSFGQAYDPIRSLKAAWSLLKQAPVTVMLGGLLLAFLESGGSAGARFNPDLDRLDRAENLDEILRQVFDQMQPWLLIMIPIALCIGIGFFALSSWIEVGFARAIELSLRTGRDEIGKVFSGGDRFGAMLLARFLGGLIQLASALPLIGAALGVVILARGNGFGPGLVIGLVAFTLLWSVVMVYVGLGLYLVNPIVALEACRPTEAIARSWSLASGNRLQLLWFLILQFLLTMAGICACCIGLLLTMPLTQVMRFEAYVALTKGEQYPQWWIGSGRFPFDEHKSEDFGSPPVPPPVPPPLPPQS